jgi:hypothetical protein
MNAINTRPVILCDSLGTRVHLVVPAVSMQRLPPYDKSDIARRNATQQSIPECPKEKVAVEEARGIEPRRD